MKPPTPHRVRVVARATACVGLVALATGACAAPRSSSARTALPLAAPVPATRPAVSPLEPFPEASAPSVQLPRQSGNFARRDDSPRNRSLLLHLGALKFSDDEVDQAYGSALVGGAEFATRSGPTGFGIEVAFFGSSESVSVGTSAGSVRADGELYELMVGGRYTIAADDLPLDLFAGGGVNLALLDLNAAVNLPPVFSGEAGDSETGLGGYLHAGLLARLAPTVGLGLDFRHTLGAQALGADLDHWTVAALLAFHF